MQKLYLIAIDIRSAHNVGSILRTSDGLAVDKVYLCGYTPYPLMQMDNRLPHLADRANTLIHKTALGAELSQSWEYVPDALEIINKLKSDGVEIVALEQNKRSLALTKYKPERDVALIIGNEVNGLSGDVLKLADNITEIPMLGKKESFNVSVAAALALFYVRCSISTSV